MSTERAAEILAELSEANEATPCTRPDGYLCRIFYDTDLCPSCTVSLGIERAYRELTGSWTPTVKETG